MKKELIRAAVIGIGATLLLPFLGGVARFQFYIEALAFTSLGVSLIMLLAGLIMVCIQSARKDGQAFLLCSGLLMLASFTLCSSGAVRLF